MPQRAVRELMGELGLKSGISLVYKTVLKKVEVFP